MLTPDQAEKLTAKALSFSKFADCSVAVSLTEQAQVRFANNGVTTAGLTIERQITISSTRDAKTGTVQITELDDAALRAAVARSEELAALAPPNPEYVEPLGPQQWPETPAPDDDTAGARTPVMVPHVKAVLDAARASKLIAAGFFQRTSAITAMANKRGLFGYHRSTGASMSNTMRNADGTSSGWAGRPTARIREIKGAELAQTAIEKCLRWKNPRKLDPGAYTVVLEPTAVSDLMGFMGFSFSARMAEEGRTFLAKKGGGTLLGEKHFPEIITLVTDPFDPRNPGSPWTQGGSPNARIAWIERGVVKNLFYDRYWAVKSGRAPTPFATSLRLEGSAASVDDLIQSVERGLLVTRFWYIRPVNQQTGQSTGLTRDGLFLIEKGKISDAVMNFRFNQSAVRMLQNTQRLGRVERSRGAEGGGMLAPALVADQFTFTSISDAV